MKTLLTTILTVLAMNIAGVCAEAPDEPGALYPAADKLAVSPGKTTYCVDPVHGDDANPAGKPWKSLAKINALKLAPGDTVTIAPGVHRETLKPSVSGTGENPVTIRFLPGVHEFMSQDALRRPWFVSNTASGGDTFRPKPVAILVEGVSHLRIEGGGVTGAGRTLIRIGGPARMVYMINRQSEQVTVSGLAFDFKRPPASEFRVLEVETNAVVVRIAEGATYEIKDGRFAWTGDLGQGWVMAQRTDLEARRAWRQDRWNPFTSATATDLGGGKVRLTYANGNLGMLAGQHYSFRHIIHDFVSVFNDRSKNIVFSDCEFNSMAAMSFVSQFTENITFRRVNAIPPAGTWRAQPVNMDMFHFANCRGQVLVESCRVSGSGDDGMNYHGIHMGIVEKLADTQLHLRFLQGETFGFAAYAPGDELAVINHLTLREYPGNARRTVKTIAPQPGDRTGKDWLVTLDGPAPTFAAGDVVDNITWQANVTVRSNLIEMASCRGILATTRGKVIIEDNTINSSMPGVLIEDDANFWWESSCVRDMVIRRNTFLNCGIEINPRTIKPEGPVHENICIEDNTFTGNASHNASYANNAPFISVRGVKGLTITGNRFAGDVSIRVDDCHETKIENNMSRPKSSQFVRKLTAGEKISIVTLGTSLTGGGWRWPDVMMNDWLNKDYPGLVTLHNLGVGASASSHPAGNSGLDKARQAAALKPDVVFIEFGTNDAYLPYKISQEDSRRNLNAMIDVILAANPNAEIILQTMNSVKDHPHWGPHATSRPEVAAYFQGYRDVAKARGLLLVDNYPNWLRLMMDNPDEFDRLVPDRIHPQAEGYRKILLPQLKATLMPQTSTDASTSELWNQDWRFVREGAGPEATDAAWETVSLPHTARIEKLDGYFYQGLCAYHKHFLAPADWRGKKVQVRFDGAM